MKNFNMTNALLGIIVTLMLAAVPWGAGVSSDINVMKEQLKHVVPSSELVSREEYTELLIRVVNLEHKLEFKNGDKSGQYSNNTGERRFKPFPTFAVHKE